MEGAKSPASQSILGEEYADLVGSHRLRVTQQMEKSVEQHKVFQQCSDLLGSHKLAVS